MKINLTVFRVDPETINEDLFTEKKEDFLQERTRRIIVEALKMMITKPERYAKSFKTIIPEKTWSYKTVDQLVRLADHMGDHLADWVEQALEWAQRITNGETWESICNEPDTENWYRLISWENGNKRLVGGSCQNDYGNPVADASMFIFESNYILDNAVPLVVFYE